MTQSIPRDPAQPSSPTYGLYALQIVETYTRASALSMGFDVPPPDPSIPLKAWKDDSPSAQGLGTIVYNFIRDGKIVREAIPKAVARQFNLPGEAAFPKYAVKPTPAMFGGGIHPVDPLTLSTEEQAQAMAEELGVPGEYFDATPVNGMFAFIAHGETRRVWCVNYKGDRNVGELVAKKNAFGVGAPVTLKLLENGPVWEGPPIATASGMIPVPVRNLLPGERIVRDPNLAGGGWIVTTLPDSGPGSPNSAIGFTQQDRAKLDEMLVHLRALTGIKL